MEDPYSANSKINFDFEFSKTVFFQVFALPAVNNGIIHQGGWLARRAVVSRFCITEVRRVRTVGGRRTSGKLVIVSTSIKPSKYHRSIGGTPEATSAIIHQRIFVTCKRHFSSVSGGSILLRPLSLSVFICMLSVCLSLALVRFNCICRPTCSLIRRINQALLMDTV